MAYDGKQSTHEDTCYRSARTASDANLSGQFWLMLQRLPKNIFSSCPVLSVEICQQTMQYRVNHCKQPLPAKKGF